MFENLLVNPLWFLPSLLVGGVYAFSSGNWLMFLATLLSAVVGFLVYRKRELPTGEISIVGSRVFVGNIRLPKSSILWGKRLHAYVAESLPMTTPKSFSVFDFRIQTRNRFQIGHETLFDLSEGAGHLLVIGPTGSGKSETIHLCLATMASNIEVRIADYKGGAVLTERRHGIGISDLDSVQVQSDFWNSIIDELSAREQNLRRLGVASVEQAEKLKLSESRLLIVVDELVAAIRNCPAALGSLTAVATRGRSLGVHLMATSQSLVGIPRELLTNLRSRLALAGTDEVELLQLGIKERFEMLPGNQRAALLSKDGSVIRVQIPLGVRKAPRPAV